jgi:hypothetical protein
MGTVQILILVALGVVLVIAIARGNGSHARFNAQLEESRRQRVALSSYHIHEPLQFCWGGASCPDGLPDTSQGYLDHNENGES